MNDLSGVDKESKEAIVTILENGKSTLLGNFPRTEVLSLLVYLHHHERAFHHKEMARVHGEYGSLISRLNVALAEQKEMLRNALLGAHK